MVNDIVPQLVNSGIAVAVLVWIVGLGVKQMQQMYSDHNTRTDMLIKHLLEDNRRLGDTLISCVSTINVQTSRGDK